MRLNKYLMKSMKNGFAKNLMLSPLMKLKNQASNFKMQNYIR